MHTASSGEDDMQPQLSNKFARATQIGAARVCGG